ncbi:MAG: hypothetical protein NTU51_10710 [Bacteroidetes bacterium]|nr:hypothetical protein [Bacteroidota bacterium]
MKLKEAVFLGRPLSFEHYKVPGYFFSGAFVSAGFAAGFADFSAGFAAGFTSAGFADFSAGFAAGLSAVFAAAGFAASFFSAGFCSLVWVCAKVNPANSIIADTKTTTFFMTMRFLLFVKLIFFAAQR